ncbi:hypothetical protein VTO58DRAFT_108233 [Aureobasidium pullulans]|nr:hypothetical protein JADG_004968 [Aureobasidium pullulans]KAG2165230.1 hypothetical protein JADG_004969 [Aureobasidium pullulans]THY76253.1 hypothetical protein D6C95_09979 [Aureobasidium pullulans]
MAENHAKNPVDMTAAAKIAYHKHVRTQMAAAKALYESGNVNLTITVLEGLLETTHCSLIVRLKAQIMLALSHELWAFAEKHRLLAESLWNRIRYIEPVGEDQFIETTLEETRQTLDKLRTLQEGKQPLDDEYDPDDTEGHSTASEETLLELGRGDIRGHIQALEAEVPFRPGQAAMKLSAMYQGVAVHTTPEYNKAVESGDMEAADSFFWEMLKKAFLEGEATAKRRVKQPATAPSQGKPELAQTPKPPSSKKKRQWFTQKAGQVATFARNSSPWHAPSADAISESPSTHLSPSPRRSFESPTARRATAARPNDHAINLNLQKTPSRSFSAKLAAITSSGGRKKVKDIEGSPGKKEQDTEREIEPPRFVFPIRKKEEKEIVAPWDTDE